MKPWIWLRVAAVLQAFGALGHTIGGTPRHAVRGPQEEALFAAMRAYRFDMMGTMRSHWDFYQGFGVTISVNLIVLFVLMWQLSNLCRSEPRKAIPMIVTILAGDTALLVVGWIYFFAAPLVASILIILCLIMAVVGSYRIELQASTRALPLT